MHDSRRSFQIRYYGRGRRGISLFPGFLQDKLKESWKKHFLFVTAEHEGILVKEAKENGLTHIPTSIVGDRFAPFSSLGLLPAVVMGIDAEKFLAGGALMFDHISKSSQDKNIAWNMAVYQYIYQRMYGINQFVTMLYISRLEEFNIWLREMWGESLGKEKKALYYILQWGLKTSTQFSRLSMTAIGSVRFYSYHSRHMMKKYLLRIEELLN